MIRCIHNFGALVPLGVIGAVTLFSYDPPAPVAQI